MAWSNGPWRTCSCWACGWPMHAFRPPSPCSSAPAWGWPVLMRSSTRCGTRPGRSPRPKPSGRRRSRSAGPRRGRRRFSRLRSRRRARWRPCRRSSPRAARLPTTRRRGWTAGGPGRSGSIPSGLRPAPGGTSRRSPSTKRYPGITCSCRGFSCSPTCPRCSGSGASPCSLKGGGCTPSSSRGKRGSIAMIVPSLGRSALR